MEKWELEGIIRKEAQCSAELLGLRDVFLWDYGDSILQEGDVKEIQDRLIALVRHLQVDVLFGFDPWSPRDFHPDQLIVGKATYWTAYFSGFPLYLPHHKDLGLETCMIPERYYFAYHPEGDHLVGLDISDTIDRKVEAVLAFESQMRWCGEIEVTQRHRMGLPVDDIDVDNYGPVIAEDVRREAAERGEQFGFDYAEVMRHLVAGEVVLT
jgi:LmbE family N-acetylglucosaminyl deacetylase